MAALIYEKMNDCEFWKERNTGRVLRYRHGSYQKLFDSKGRPVSIEDGSDSAKFRYDKCGKLVMETHKSNEFEYKKWYSYDERGNILSITDSFGNKEMFGADGVPFYFITGRPAPENLLS